MGGNVSRVSARKRVAVSDQGRPAYVLPVAASLHLLFHLIALLRSFRFSFFRCELRSAVSRVSSLFFLFLHSIFIWYHLLFFFLRFPLSSEKLPSFLKTSSMREQLRQGGMSSMLQTLPRRIAAGYHRHKMKEITTIIPELRPRGFLPVITVKEKQEHNSKDIVHRQTLPYVLVQAFLMLSK